MWLQNGKHRVLTTPQGGSILQWQYGQDFILGPARTVDIDGNLKVRGEAHWCYPNFGAIDPEAGWHQFPQHGFFRNAVLDVVASSEGMVRFSRPSAMADQVREGSLIDLSAMAVLTPGGVTAALEVRNLGDARIPILPAFHPYFAVPAAGLVVSMDGRPVAKSIRGGAQGVGSKAIVLPRTGAVVVDLIDVGIVELGLDDDCTHIVIWSDRPSAYVCVEPAFGTPRTYGTAAGPWLEPGGISICKVNFGFTPA